MVLGCGFWGPEVKVWIWGFGLGFQELGVQIVVLGVGFGQGHRGLGCGWAVWGWGSRYGCRVGMLCFFQNWRVGSLAEGFEVEGEVLGLSG